MNLTNNELSITEITNQISSLNIEPKEPKIGYLFDERMLLHKDSSEKHQECPERVMAIYINLIFKNLTEKLIRIPIEEAKEKDILRVHTKEYYDQIYNLQFDSSGNPRKKTETKKTLKEKDSYDNAFTYDSAIVSVGSLINVCNYVIAKKVDHAFAIIRPPGHHANIENCHGFCYFNNVAIATEYLIEKHKLKVAIVDWDVHHGDGTQQIFYKKNNPLFISIHRHDNGLFYPYATGKSSEQGEDGGKGYNINLPWNTKIAMTNGDSSIGDAEYMLAFDKLVLPVLREYNPDIILISCGFDAGENDSSGMLKCTPIAFSYMTKTLMTLGKSLVFALEGGYCIDTIKRCSEAVIRTLLGDNLSFKNLMINHYEEWNSIVNNKALNVQKIISSYSDIFIPCNYAVEQIKDTLVQYSSFWKSLSYSINDINSKYNKQHQLIKRSTIDLNDYPQLKELIIEPFENDSLFFQKNDNFIIFRIGKDIPLSSPKEPNEITNGYLRKRIKILKTVLPQLNFNIEAIRCSKLRSNATKLEKLLNWSKDDGKYDMNQQVISTIVSKFFQTLKVKKEALIKSFDEFMTTFSSLEKQIDLFNCEILLTCAPVIESLTEKEIVKEDNPKETIQSIKAKMKKQKIAKQAQPKTNITLRINGIKQHNIIKVENDSFTKSNFINGIILLKNFINDNVLI